MPKSSRHKNFPCQSPSSASFPKYFKTIQEILQMFRLGRCQIRASTKMSLVNHHHQLHSKKAFGCQPESQKTKNLGFFKKIIQNQKYCSVSIWKYTFEAHLAQPRLRYGCWSITWLMHFSDDFGFNKNLLREEKWILETLKIERLEWKKTYHWGFKLF